MKAKNSAIVIGALMTAMFWGGCGKPVEDKPNQPLTIEGFETDTFKTTMGDLAITFIGHGTLMMTCGGKVIHIDPWTNLADYAKLPKADLILITHDHRDHLDPSAIALLRKDNTAVLMTKGSTQTFPDGQVMENGQSRRIEDFEVEAVAAYNLAHMRSEGQPFHPKGNGNGYVITFGKTRIYIAGDTENTSEMKALKNIDIAFLPMNLPYTMTPEMVAEAARVLQPKILYPYHYGQTDPKRLVDLLKDSKTIEVRIRRMK
jgi:L-ascorbate metabolism protein UlaG (beta-lactamase superfamily)